MSKIDHSLFDAHEHALEQAYGACPECSGALSLKHGKSGAFIGCNHYPACDFTKPLHEVESAELKQIEGSSCPQCSDTLAIKRGRYGLFIGCTRFPDCHYMDSVKQHDDTHLTCPQCNDDHLIKRSNKYGKHFYACSGFPKCKYALNHKPVARTCPACDWPVMVEKSSAKGPLLQCPQKHCQYKIEV